MSTPPAPYSSTRGADDCSVPAISVIVTRRLGESDRESLETLRGQTYRNMQIIRIEDKEKRGANWARNKGKVRCDSPWSARRLRDFKRGNIVSTMSLVRKRDFPGFDESIRRLQDWDVWLTMLSQGKKGVHCGSVIFETITKQGGITFGDYS
jgi:hypothetical protein